VSGTWSAATLAVESWARLRLVLVSEGPVRSATNFSSRSMRLCRTVDLPLGRAVERDSAEFVVAASYG